VLHNPIVDIANKVVGAVRVDETVAEFPIDNEIEEVSDVLTRESGITKECVGMDVIVTEHNKHDNVSSFSQVWLFHSQDAVGNSSGTTRTSPTLQNFGICCSPSNNPK
jgi:hypothetical protein